ncbi:hypothetical protein [Leptospira noguchii]|uniref:Uncharacterized protein n=5 Tax=Leptospira noguchii TaxID=28182 RepID=M6VIG5_9LEPT|nr:hypothetical protein [Leptospira noguchii]EKR74839.1 hypothetical protein LEP1GSC041_3050 [Leptospira noguchii str. 2006001870]EMI70746.1 hypothetical protein LEP1GSC072_4150 [Leptospira noguchii str. Bonito]EMN02243.1 hypothetical protein LEP1GSC035_4523 [Leptospira noguchii str. 2007001578]EMO40755.1 hypothetical protein LEP1GSC186_0592 [Leptospira noguchii serovar Autumnalis str. ZUN142]EMO54841.1 hypothetical protein LEP1GSC172_3544 [Leptospira noguchii]
MLKEINFALQSSTGARQFSKSEFTIRNMPDRLHPLSELESVNSGARNIAKVGVNTDDQAVRRGYLIDLNA